MDACGMQLGATIWDDDRRLPQREGSGRSAATGRGHTRPMLASLVDDGALVQLN